MHEQKAYFFKPATDDTFLMLSSPHSGYEEPEDFHYVCSANDVRHMGDHFVDELISGGPDVGASIISSRYCRSYIDLNRAEDDMDPAIVDGVWPLPLQPSPGAFTGAGLIRRDAQLGVCLYDKPLPVAEIQRRIEIAYRPYHSRLQAELDFRHEQYGKTLLIDCHSFRRKMCAHLSPEPEIVLGNRDGTSCAEGLIQAARLFFEGKGYCVYVNLPYKGMETTRRHGEPSKNRHVLQLEMNRHLYMDEEKLEKAGGFIPLQKNLTEFFKMFVEALR